MKEGQPKREKRVFINAKDADSFMKSGGSERGTIFFGTDSIKFHADKPVVDSKPAGEIKPEAKPEQSATTPDKQRVREEQHAAGKWFRERYGVED